MIRQPKILYIDDEADLLNLAASFFEDEDLPLDVSDNFTDALAKIRKETYDLIISDARMPSGSGKELLSIIRKEKIFTGKFILLTGNLDYKNDLDQQPYDLILFKPLRFQDLVDRVKLMLDLELK